MKEIIFDKAGAEPRINDTEEPVPGEAQITVRSLWTAMNPIDALTAKYGMLVEKFPIGLGADASGIVVQVGKVAEEKYGFKPGDYVCGCTRVAQREYNTARELFLMDAQVAMRRPSNLSAVEACTLGAAFQTASLGLFEEGMNIPHPDPKKDIVKNGEWMLVLGGAGSVGRAAVQLAAASGYSVIASCSDKSNESVKGIGAAAAFDYNLSIDEQLYIIEKTTGGAEILKIFDATSAEDPVLAKAVFAKSPVTSNMSPKHFATTNDWSNVQIDDVSIHEIHLGLIGHAEAPEINNSIEVANKLIVSLFEAGLIHPQEHEVVGEGGFQDAIKAYKHQVGSRKVVVKIQDE